MNAPIKFELKKEWWPLAIIILTLAVSYYAYPLLPAKVVSHWDFRGVANGYSSKEFQTWFFPAMIIGLYALFFFLPILDPKKERYAEFTDVYNIFKNLIISIFFVIFLATTVFNLGVNINVGVIVASAIGILMITMGNYFGKLKQNWFIGIRTPWTLSSENVWNKTHRLGGKLFVIWGVGIIIAPWLSPTLAFIVFIGGAILASIGSFIYSYVIFKKEKAGK